jgi:hypothetical protein
MLVDLALMLQRLNEVLLRAVRVGLRMLAHHAPAVD